MIKRLLLALAFLLVQVIAPQAWYSDGGGELQGYRVGGRPPPVLTFLQCSAEITTDQTTYSFTTQNTGTATDDRYTIVGINARDSASAFTISSATVGGDAVTIVENVTAAGQRFTGIGIVLNVAGTSETVSVTMSEAITSMRICLWQVTGLDSATKIASATSDATPSVPNLNVSAFGIAIGTCGKEDVNATATWVNLTERADPTGAAEISVTAGDFTNNDLADTPLTMSITPSVSNIRCSTASWL